MITTGGDPSLLRRVNQAAVLAARPFTPAAWSRAGRPLGGPARPGCGQRTS